MPRPRTQRSPTAPASGSAADIEANGNEPTVAAQQDQTIAYRPRDPAQEQILRSLSNTLSREMKLAALNWRGGCFCCPANISFAQCMAGLWQAARKPAESVEALVHWGLNASKFLFEAGPKSSFGRRLLLQAGFTSLVLQLLPLCEEVPQSIALTPQVVFVQIFAIGRRQLPLSTTPQLVVLGLLALATLSPASLRTALLAPAGPQLISALIRALAESSDDRFWSLTFQTLTEWINIKEGDPVVDDDDNDDDNDEAEEEGEQKRDDREATDAGQGGRATTAMAARGALIDALLDAGLAPAVVHVLESSSNAAALRDACALLLAMLAGGVGGGGGASSSWKAVAGSSGRPGAGGHGPTRVQGPTAMELPPDAHLEGQSTCRARVELLKAGLVPALLSALRRRPSQFCYWVAINLGVTGARHLEMQWLMLVIARMSVLPSRLSAPEPSAKCVNAGADATQQAASDPLPAAASGAADSSEVAVIAAVAASSGKGGHPTPGARAQRVRSQRNGVEDPVQAAAEAEQLRLSAVDLLLQSDMLSSLSVESFRSTPVASSAGRGSAPQAPPPAAAEAGIEAEAEVEVEAATRAETGASGACVDAAAAAAAENTATPAAAAESTTTLSADVQAVKLLSRAIAASTLCSCVLPDGTPLELLPPRERNATPDFRALQRDRIRKAAEEARAAQALASANAAVDVLSKAVASL
ncbi:hypothetical protein VaNZ11_011239 [Volvox africanus]|uniref:Ataxin-10 domain-containing protein n=1 Tax=Volvox africanus TaxID=51714 RepID=A0ABQ5SB18_9CHLO|nr:hypothetical protein VaNZ11_011239 [Volvox africanus]